ncbi:hypothetical protein LOK49_LG03G02997 [Camellia lanceoleosa]|uniref:Uncharacterized protein n=1 Tax=Camellia lanceoleosa TaxID=1840588 RepID=A0ACC0IEU2_9ERIC|nr:hypothetical protein LOK49_LG03G02997 [Camellia lanceoleosa]
MLLPTPPRCVSSITVCVSSGGCVSSENVSEVPISCDMLQRLIIRCHLLLSSAAPSRFQEPWYMGIRILSERLAREESK